MTGKNITETRHQTGMTQLEFARLLALDPHTLSRLENDHITARPTDAELLALISMRAAKKKVSKLRQILLERGRLAALKSLI